MEKTAEQETAKTFQRTRMVVMAAAFAALACVATMVVKVPSPTGGYMNLGDTVVLLGGYLLGPAWGALAGSIGPALADVLLGSPIYAPATLVIKAGMAALAAACHQAFGKGRGPLGLAACGIVGELPMVVGYWLYDALLLGLDSAPVAAFVAGVLVGISAEITARLRKGPAIVYATMGVIPLVPGYGLYRTMEYMVQTDYMQALAAGMETALVAGAIALSLGFSTVVARNAFRLLGLRHHRG